MQVKTVRQGPRVEDCEIREAGDDSWSVQSSDYLVLKAEGCELVVASRDPYTRGVEVGDRLTARLGAPVAAVVARRAVSREQAALALETLAKLAEAKPWSLWRVAERCLVLTLDGALPAAAGDSLFSPDRMGNGFVFRNNRIHSSGRVLIKASGMVEGNVLDTPHALVVCPEVPGAAAAGIDGLVIRGNTIRRAGWFCPAPWSSQAGALSVTAGLDAQKLRAAGVFANLRIEQNVFEECVGPNVVVSSARGVRLRDNRFVRPQHERANDTGARYGIARDAVVWLSACEGVDMGDNPIFEPGPFCGEAVVKKEAHDK